MIHSSDDSLLSVHSVEVEAKCDVGARQEFWNLFHEARQAVGNLLSAAVLRRRAKSLLKYYLFTSWDKLFIQFWQC